MKNAAPLTGITVLAIEQAIAAPLCTRQLAELGARVIKIERPGTGDFARHYDDRVKGLSSHFVWTNRSKQSLTLDLKQPEALQIVRRLLASTDVLVQNLAPGAVERMGLAYQSLQAEFPRLICCDISGYGASGSYASKKAYDLLLQAEAGLLTVTGTATDMAKSGISIADIAAGMQAHSAILAALIQRGNTGRGSQICVSLLEAMVEWMGYPLYYAYEGAEPPPRTGSDHATIFPYGAFATGDEQLLMLGLQNEREWQVFCREILEDESLASDSRFCGNPQRSANRAQLRAIIEEKFSACSVADIKRKLDAARIACADVNELSRVWAHPQLQEMKRLTSFSSPVGTLRGFLPPASNSEFEHTLSAVPALGEHTEKILQELGYGETDCARLRAEAVI